MTRAQRQYLNGVDTSELMEVADIAGILDHAARFRKRYQLPDTTMAALLLEMASGAQAALERVHEEGTADEVRLSVKTWYIELTLLAAALTRVVRGKPPLTDPAGAAQPLTFEQGSQWR